jgi:hypothetical protein
MKKVIFLLLLGVLITSGIFFMLDASEKINNTVRDIVPGKTSREVELKNKIPEDLVAMFYERQ